MKTKHYEIHNYAQGDEYITESSDLSNIDDIWTTKIPWDFKPAEGYFPTPPLKFYNRKEAVRIKDMIKSARLDEWNRNSYIYKRYGDRKPNWKVYEFESSFLPDQ